MSTGQVLLRSRGKIKISVPQSCGKIFMVIEWEERKPFCHMESDCFPNGHCTKGVSGSCGRNWISQWTYFHNISQIQLLVSSSPKRESCSPKAAVVWPNTWKYIIILFLLLFLMVGYKVLWSKFWVTRDLYALLPLNLSFSGFCSE